MIFRLFFGGGHAKDFTPQTLKLFQRNNIPFFAMSRAQHFVDVHAQKEFFAGIIRKTIAVQIIFQLMRSILNMGLNAFVQAFIGVVSENGK